MQKNIRTNNAEFEIVRIPYIINYYFSTAISHDQAVETKKEIKTRILKKLKMSVGFSSGRVMPRNGIQPKSGVVSHTSKM